MVIMGSPMHKGVKEMKAHWVQNAGFIGDA